MATSTFNNNGYITRIALTDLPANSRVQFCNAHEGKHAELATAVELAIGTIEQPALAGQPITIRLFNTPGTRFGIANASVSKLAKLYSANAGKLGVTGDNEVGIALSDASADGDVLEYLPTTLLG
jgi:hypothetical protein